MHVCIQVIHSTTNTTTQIAANLHQPIISHSLFTPAKLIASSASISKALMSCDLRSDTAPLAIVGRPVSQIMLEMCVYRLSACLQQRSVKKCESDVSNAAAAAWQR